jgi:DNA repair protein RadD
MKKELHEDQKAALEALREAVGAGKRRIAMQAPTGMGKTVIAAALVEAAREKGKKVLFTVPTISLVDQTVEMFASQGITEVGVIQASHYMSDWSQPVQVASVQTLMKRTIPQADVVLIDECHKWFKFYERWVGTKDFWKPEWAKVPFIGLSATPWTKGLGSWFDHFHRAATTQDMIDAGRLSPFKVYAPTHPDLTGVRTVAGDYHEGELSDRMRELVGDAVDTWLRLGEGRPTLCYAVDRAHAKHLQLKFEAAGVPCGYIDAYTADADKRGKESHIWIDGRRTVKKKFHNGEIKVVCSVGTLTVGIDWDVRCISMCRPTKSDMLFTQIIGRGLRNSEGKDQCLILDHSDNHLRLGFVTDIDASYTGLHVGQTPAHDNRTDNIRLPKECPKCAFLKPPGMALCPSCGFLAQIQNKIMHEKGELRELKPKPKPVEEREALWVATMEEKALFFSELKYYGMRQGYKYGWAPTVYREKTGVWPNHPSIKNMPPARWVRECTLNYIKSRMIAHAKMRSPRSGVEW